jgi:hypothetical protein
MAGILNTEKFSNNTPVVKAFDRTFANEVTQTKEDIKQLFFQLRNSKYLSNIVFDSKLFEFSELFVKDFFNNIYQIMQSYANIGTHEAIILLVKNILGANTNCSFSSDLTYDLILTISSTGIAGGNVITTESDDIVTIDSLNVAYTTNRLGYTEQQLIDLIVKFLPIGIKYKIIFITAGA